MWVPEIYIYLQGSSLIKWGISLASLVGPHPVAATYAPPSVCACVRVRARARARVRIRVCARARCMDAQAAGGAVLAKLQSALYGSEGTGHTSKCNLNFT